MQKKGIIKDIMSAQAVGVRVRLCRVEEPDHQHRRRLRARRERPRSPATNYLDEIPPPLNHLVRKPLNPRA